jgi:hypothetical protein
MRAFLAVTSPDLSGVGLKLDRASKHIEALRAEIAAFAAGDPAPLGFRAEPPISRPDGSLHYVLYAIVREDPPRTLAPIIGDALHNIRSALDQLAYELASLQARKSRTTQFPICMDESQFRQADSLRKIASITGDERDLIERVQPYNAIDPPRHDPLAILNKLSNRDKHRLLVPCVAAVNTAESWVASSNAEVNFEFIEPGPVKHNARIVALTARPKNPSAGMTLHPRSGLQIALSDTGADDLRLEVVELLEMIHHHVRHTVIGAWFEYGYMPPTWAEVQALQQRRPCAT